VLNPAAGSINEYELSRTDSWPAGLAMDSQGSLWFSSQLQNRVCALVVGGPKDGMKVETSAPGHPVAQPAHDPGLDASAEKARRE